ncbi:solute carrier family 35 member G1-like [Bolinopsis microptera]|uniref:solute carrier family 35 member G1-like n=1 Tax=Bolinopsis microptera TaxID=2820187 RepID=UPI00307A9C7C
MRTAYSDDTEELIAGEDTTFEAVQLVLPNGKETRQPDPRPTERETLPPAPETRRHVTFRTEQHARFTSDVPAAPQTEPLRCSKVVGLTLVLMSSALYCLSIALAKRTPSVGSPEICCIQCGVCIGVLVMCATHQGISVLVPRDKVVGLATVSISGAAGLLLTVSSVQHMRFGDAILLLYTAPLFSGLFAKIVFKEKCGVVNFTSAFACFLGIVFTLQPPIIFSKMSHKDANLSLTVCALALVGAICLGACYTAVRVQGASVSLLTTLFWLNVILLPTSVAVQLITATPYTAPHCGSDRLYLLLSGLLMLVSLYLFFRALSRDITTPAVLMRNTDVLFGYCFQALWFKESVDVLNVIGLIMITGGVSAIFLHKLLKNVHVSLRTIEYGQLREEEEPVQQQVNTV